MTAPTPKDAKRRAAVVVTREGHQPRTGRLLCVTGERAKVALDPMGAVIGCRTAEVTLVSGPTPCPHETYRDGRWMRCELRAGHEGAHVLWAAARAPERREAGAP